MDLDKVIAIDLYNLKSKVDQLDFDKYKTAPIDLKKLSNVADKYLMETNIV